MADASIEELTQIKGIGPAKATQLKAAFELGKRVEGYAEVEKRGAIKNPEDAVKQLKIRLKGKKKEHFWALFLDTRNQVIKEVEISVGSLDASIVHPREVFKEAVSASAASVIFVHNHPSGDPQPSEEDIKLTRRLVEAGELMGIDVLDHIIVCPKEYLSMKGKRLM
jgi:DNA repair protein RadC